MGTPKSQDKAYHPLTREDHLLPSGGPPNGSGLGVLPSGESNFFWYAQIIRASGGDPELDKFYPHPTGSYFRQPYDPYDEFHTVSSVFPTHPRDVDKNDFINKPDNTTTSIADSMAAPGPYDYTSDGRVKKVPIGEGLSHDFSNGLQTQKTTKASGIYDFTLFNPYIHYYPDPEANKNIILGIAGGEAAQVLTKHGPLGRVEVPSKPLAIYYRIYVEDKPRWDKDGNPISDKYFLRKAKPYETYPSRKFTNETIRKPFDVSESGIQEKRKENEDRGIEVDVGLPLNPRSIAKDLGSDAYPSGNIPLVEFDAPTRPEPTRPEEVWGSSGSADTHKMDRPANGRFGAPDVAFYWDYCAQQGDVQTVKFASRNAMDRFKVFSWHTELKDAVWQEWGSNSCEYVDGDGPSARRCANSLTCTYKRRPPNRPAPTELSMTMTYKVYFLNDDETASQPGHQIVTVRHVFGASTGGDCENDGQDPNSGENA